MSSHFCVVLVATLYSDVRQVLKKQGNNGKLVYIKRGNKEGKLRRLTVVFCLCGRLELVWVDVFVFICAVGLGSE